MKTETITIIGLGRTGASVGLALRQADLGLTVAGYDDDREVAKAAQEAGAVDRIEGNLGRAAASADILILAVPVQTVEKVLQLVGDRVRAHALVLDLTGLKARSQALARKYLVQGHFVGAAPVLAAEALAEGDGGPAAARADLFQNSVFCLMPAPQADPQAVETSVNVGRVLGAQPFFLDPAEYDSLAQGVETMPGLLAAALFRSVTRASGWRDILRFAGSNFYRSTAALEHGEVVAHLALHDRAATLRWLDALLAQMQEIRDWVDDGDEERLAALLQQLGLERAKWLQERAENDWEQIPASEVTPFSIREQMFGRWGRQDD